MPRAIIRLRAEGDRLRDERRWKEAASSYAAYLEARADDWPIWVQYGHCLKEAGDVTGGLGAYRRALTLEQSNSDLHLQIGHALKLLGAHGDALEAYRTAQTLDPENNDAKAESAAMQRALDLAKAKTEKPKPVRFTRLMFDVSAAMEQAPNPASAEAEKPKPVRLTRLMFDISDLIQYMKEWRIPTGIQRVQLNVIFNALTAFEERTKPLIIHFDQSLGNWRPISRDVFLNLHDAAMSSDGLAEEEFLALFEETEEAEESDSPFERELAEHDIILVNLGTSWWIENYFLKIRALRAKYGIRYVPMIHDVIPLMMPEHCAQRLVEEFSQWFSTLVFEVDGAVTNSHWSAMDIRHHVAKLLPELSLPVYPVALNGDMRSYLAGRADGASEGLHHILPPKTEFVLFVGTLESRKDHLLVFRAWEALLEKHDADRVPVLICLGKPGWLFGEGAEFLRSRPLLSSKIMLISSVSDSALQALYRECLFTLANSFYEGWGLPVTESLSYGTLPLVACNTSLTEAGGRAAVYFRASDKDDLVSKLEMLVFDEEKRLQLREHARATAVIRDWRQVAGDFIDHIMKIEASAGARQAAFLRAPIGRVIHFGKSDALSPSLDLAMANLLRDGLNWHRLEDWGCWTAPGTAIIRLPLPDEAVGQDLMLFLRLRGTAIDTTVNLHCCIDGEAISEPVQRMVGHGTRHNIAFRLRPGASNLTLSIDTGAGSSLGPGDRDVGIGVTHALVCRVDDLRARQDFMMRFPELQEKLQQEDHMIVDVMEIPAQRD